ncbi:phosphomevalonate kinase [Oceanobacillus sojae]|uniref:phosphomevalonate kinase n=1 Tax=Oceanobacillus sojae TaxID=582851 RepID=UPI00363FECF7
MSAPIIVKIPGKLTVAGEYAVLENDQKLVVMAVNRFVYAALEQSDENRLSLLNYGLTDLEWEWTGHKVSVKSYDSRIRFVENAITVVYTYLREHNITLKPCRLSVRSELDDTSGSKYGLGSSAAVVTAVVSAILKRFLPYEPSKQLIFKLASISHVITQGNGSGADVAASSYGGLLQYSSFQADWLLRAYNDVDTITKLAESYWPYFTVKSIKLPATIHMCIGWTGSPAFTSSFISKFRDLKDSNPSQYEQFLSESRVAVSNFLNGVTYADPVQIIEGIRLNRRALAELGRNGGVDVETPALTDLCDLAEQHGGVGKPSGAGGGDCGIAFLPSEEKAEQLKNAWKKAGIKPLDLTLHSNELITI